MSAQQEMNLARVSTSIAPLVLDFCRLRWHRGADARTFSMHELTEHVKARANQPIAPDSPGRILRQLAAAGQITYRVVMRAASLYELVSVAAHG